MNPNELLTHAYAAAIDASGGLPRDIQWMPPGRQVVQPLGFDEPFEMDVTREIADAADKQLQKLRSAHATGQDVEPYGDFNHKDEGRAFTAKRFFWGGDDPKEGGVRLELDWTGAGARAVREGELNVLSPTWVLNKITKAFVGVRHNLGGLVPRSAFHGIQAFAKAETDRPNKQPAGPSTQHNTQPMDAETKQQLADLTTAVTKLTETVTAQAKDLQEIKAKAPAAAPPAAGSAAAAGATDPKIVVLETKFAGMEAQLKDQATASARAKVADAVKGGKIPAQNKELIAQWENLLVADARNAALLDTLPVNPALQTVVGAGAATTGTGNNTAEGFAAEVQVHAKAGKTKSQALDIAMAKSPDGYKAWRDANGKPAL